MATSSILKSFVVEGDAQVEKFADAIEKSYQESLVRKPTCIVKATRLRGSAIREFMERRKYLNE